MKLGADPKKVAVLGGLVALALVIQLMSGDDRPTQSTVKKSTTVATPNPAGQPSAAVQPAARVTPRPNSARGNSQEFKPVLKSRRPEDRIDPASIDPTLRLDLISRLAAVKIQGGNRSLFEFGAPPAPKAPDPGKIIPTKPVAIAKAPETPPVVKPIEPQKPKAPPIPLKFYGFTQARGGPKRAFFLENEDVYVANEGQSVKNRYKIVRISLSSVVMEDTQFKQEQTLPLVEQMQ